jgi:hypothetical protein
MLVFGSYNLVSRETGDRQMGALASHFLLLSPGFTFLLITLDGNI